MAATSTLAADLLALPSSLTNKKLFDLSTLISGMKMKLSTMKVAARVDAKKCQSGPRPAIFNPSLSLKYSPLRVKPKCCVGSKFR